MKKTLNKMEILKQRMESLKIEQEKIEQELIEDFIKVMKLKNVTQLDFNTLVGGFLEVVEGIQAGSNKVEGWKSAGEKFRKSIHKQKPKAALKAATAVG